MCNLTGALYLHNTKSYHILRIMRKLFILLLIIYSCSPRVDHEVLIYGGTSAGVIAAYTAAQMGKSVVLVVPGRHIGGLTSGGLGMTDIGNKDAVTGIAREFYRKVGEQYDKFEQWRFEPHVASQVFAEYLKHENIKVKENFWIDSVKMKNSEIKEAIFFNMDNQEESLALKAHQYIDCTYEGELMAKAGVSYTVGRESNQKYNETYNGVQLVPHNHQFEVAISPFIIAGDPDSGILPGINTQELAVNGSGDNKVQAYNYRLCLTKNKENKIPFYKPEYYNPLEYELLARLIATRDNWQIRDFLILSGMPNGKTDVNNKGPVSTDFIGRNWEYPEAGFAEKMQIRKIHADYIKGLLYFLANDKRLPDHLRKNVKEWGYAADEFTDNKGFPPQMYVREARRMIGEYVMTEHNCLGDSIVDDGIGKAAYGMDSHYCQRIIINGKVKNEGNINIEDFPPYPIAYRAITPQKKECSNLLVPVALSASHIAYGSIRMEPVFMVLGQSAAMAASLAIDGNGVVQEIDVKKLQEQMSNNPKLNGTPQDILLDNNNDKAFSLVGDWQKIERNSIPQPYKGTLHLTENVQGKKAIFSSTIKKSGYYKVFVYHPIVIGYKKPYSNNTAFQVKSDELEKEVRIDFSAMPINQYWGDWAPLGTYNLQAGEKVEIIIDGDSSEPPLVADAIILVWDQSEN